MSPSSTPLSSVRFTDWIGAKGAFKKLKNSILFEILGLFKDFNINFVPLNRWISTLVK